MDGYESTRREFLKKLGLIASATAISATGLAQVESLISDKKDAYQLTPEQSKFMEKYEKWLDEFHDMAKFQKQDAEHLENNKKLVALSEEAKKWQAELIEHMKDDNFARYYMIVTEKVTVTI
jgi:nucleoid-associated protein YejK